MHRSTYREHHRHTASYRLTAVQLRRLAHPQVLAAISFPADDRRAVEQDLDAVACWERCNDTPLLGVYAGLRAGAGGRDGGGLIGTVHLELCVVPLSLQVYECGGVRSMAKWDVFAGT